MDAPGSPLRRHLRTAIRGAGAVAAISALGIALSGANAHSAAVQPPPGNTGFDLQIGGAYAPPADASVVERDCGATQSVLLRDRDLVTPGRPGYVREAC